VRFPEFPPLAQIGQTIEPMCRLDRRVCSMHFYQQQRYSKGFSRVIGFGAPAFNKTVKFSQPR